MRSLQQIGLRACGTCRDFAPVFERQAATSHAAFFRVDIEDHEVVVDSIEVENFPTLLIARGDAVLFFGPITPQRQTLSTLLVQDVLQFGAPLLITFRFDQGI